MSLKAVARAALHNMGGLSALRYISRRKFRILTFHSFTEANRANVEHICSYVTRRFEPLPLAALVAALKSGAELPDNALAITVDDGYQNYLLYGHPIFRRHKIPVTLYAVAGFAAGRLWLWPDQIEFGIQQTSKPSLSVRLGSDAAAAFALTSVEEKSVAVSRLAEMLKVVPNRQRLEFMAAFGGLCGVQIPALPPANCAAMNWDELRAVASDGVEIGCHTESHPILTRLESPQELEREIKGAKELLEQGLGFPVHHFCYPNGKAPDIDGKVVAQVRAAGFDSATTCLWGLNDRTAEPLHIQRLPFDAAIDFRYGVELLAGLHF